MYRSRYDYPTVAEAASGHWSYIASCIAPQLGLAIERMGRHVPCPIHGGKDGFRVYKDFEETGGGSSNKDGQFANGFRLLCWVQGENPDNQEAFRRMVDRVGDVICPNRAKVHREPKKGDVMEFQGVLKSFGYAEHRFDKPDQPPAFCVVLSAPFGEKKFFTEKLKEVVHKGGFQKGDYVCVRRIDVTEDGSRYRRARWEMERTERPAPRVREKSILEVRAEDQAPAELSESAERIWNSSVRLNFSDPAQQPAARYLARRGIRVRDAALNVMDGVRFNPHLAYYDADQQKVTGHYPALVFAVRRFDGEMINCHRIYLSEDGAKAPVPQPKKMTQVASGNSVTGAAIPLLKPEYGLIGVAEGPETALAAATATGIAVWSTVSAGMMERFVPPQNVKCVMIFADKDASMTGQQAAMKLYNRLLGSGIIARIFLPKDEIPAGGKGVDWNDMLLKHGESAFPRFQFG